MSVKLLLGLLRRASFLAETDLSTIMINNTERLLNLPGRLPFFPTRMTDPEKVKSLIARLHPVTSAKALIRLGPNGDGGYLIPDDLEGIEACFSPGVCNVAGFELDCAKMGMDVFMADASVDKPPIDHAQFKFQKKFIGSSTQGNFISLEDWVISSSSKTADLLLQMDIEGYEYEAF